MTYVSKEATAFKHDVFVLAKAAGVSMRLTPMQISIILHPKLTLAGAASKVLIDLDNSIKITIDSLNRVAWEDDKQVRRISAEYGEPVQGGGMTVNIREFV